MKTVRTVADLIQSITSKYANPHTSAEMILVKHWSHIVGNMHAQTSRPIKINPKTHQLVIGTTTPLVRQELMFQKQDLLRKIQALPSCQFIQNVTICIA